MSGDLDSTPAPRSHALFVITSDPCQSHLPAEAIRIATGVSVWRKTRMTLYLGSALLSALRGAQTILDERIINQHMPDLLSVVHQLLVSEQDVDLLPESFRQCNWHGVAPSGLARVMVGCDHVLHF